MPDTASVHFDVALTNISIAYRNATYLAPDLAPDVPVRRQSDRYFIYDPRKDRFRQTFDGRSPGAEASEIDFQLSSDSYYADDHALEAAVPDEERDNADSPLQPEIDRTEFLTDKILLNQEIALAARLRDPAVIPNIDVTAASTAWDVAGADPVADVEAARAAILTATQQLPNILVLPFSVYTKVRNSAAVKDRVKYTSASAPGAGELAALFDVERVLVARAVRNTAAAGQEPVMQPVWGKDVLLLHTPPRVTLKSVVAARTFMWTQAPAGSRGVSVQTWREERRKATLVRVQKYYDIKVVAPGAAFLLRNAIA